MPSQLLCCHFPARLAMLSRGQANSAGLCHDPFSDGSEGVDRIGSHDPHFGESAWACLVGLHRGRHPCPSHWWRRAPAKLLNWGAKSRISDRTLHASPEGVWWASTLGQPLASQSLGLNLRARAPFAVLAEHRKASPFGMARNGLAFSTDPCPSLHASLELRIWT